MQVFNKLKAAATGEKAELRGPPEQLAELGERGRIPFEEAAGSSFNVRVGPNYPKHGNKAPSLESLYELVSVDVFKTQYCVTHLAQRLRMPTPLTPDGAPSSLLLPPWLLVSVGVPQDAPSLLNGHQETGPTLTTAFCFRLTKAAMAAASSPSPPAAVQLLARYFASATTDESVKKTFKMIGRARNYDALGLPGWMKRFNGKPVIINQSGEVFTGVANGVPYLEMDILVGRWTLWAKQGLHTLMPRYKEIDAEVGFVLQGTEDSELPEQMLGAARLPFVDVASFPELTD